MLDVTQICYAMSIFIKRNNNKLFHDSFAEPQSTISLDVAVDHCREAINLFFDNKFEEAKAVMDPWYLSFCVCYHFSLFIY